MRRCGTHRVGAAQGFDGVVASRFQSFLVIFKHRHLLHQSSCVPQGRSCHYYHGVQKMREQHLLQRVHGVCEAWDIEDLVALGRRLRSCPYFAARELVAGAAVVFCPYNYLLDPLIRESVSLQERPEESRTSFLASRVFSRWKWTCPARSWCWTKPTTSRTARARAPASP